MQPEKVEEVGKAKVEVKSEKEESKVSGSEAKKTPSKVGFGTAYVPKDVDSSPAKKEEVKKAEIPKIEVENVSKKEEDDGWGDPVPNVKKEETKTEATKKVESPKTDLPEVVLKVEKSLEKPSADQAVVSTKLLEPVAKSPVGQPTV